MTKPVEGSSSERVPKAPAASSPASRAVMRGNRSTDTRPEVLLRSQLHRLGLRFRKNVRPSSEVRVRADILFSRYRIAVFLDGCFWHCCPEHGVMPATNRDYWEAKLASNRLRDYRNNNLLEAAGWAVVRVWEHEDPAIAAGRIAQLIETRRQHHAEPDQRNR